MRMAAMPVIDVAVIVPVVVETMLVVAMRQPGVRDDGSGNE
jgi:hypothetical protein